MDDLSGIIRNLTLFLGVVYVAYVGFTSSWRVRKELIHDKTLDPPSDHEIRWHLRHMREDMATLTKLVLVLVILSLVNLQFS